MLAASLNLRQAWLLRGFQGGLAADCSIIGRPLLIAGSHPSTRLGPILELVLRDGRQTRPELCTKDVLSQDV